MHPPLSLSVGFRKPSKTSRGTFVSKKYRRPSESASGGIRLSSSSSTTRASASAVHGTRRQIVFIEISLSSAPSSHLTTSRKVCLRTSPFTRNLPYPSGAMP